MSIPSLLALYCALLFLVAGFAAGETALFAQRWWRRRALRRDKRLAPLLDELEKRPGRLLFALLAGSEIAGIAAAMTADGLRQRITGGAGPGGFFIAVALTGLCTAVLGELLPKIYAASRPESVAGRLASPLRLWLRFAGRGADLLGVGAETERQDRAGADISAMVAQARAGGQLSAQEARLLTGLDSLGRLPVAAVMTPHPDVEGVAADASIAAAAELMRRTGFTRLVLYDAAGEDWPGYIHAADLLRAQGGEGGDAETNLLGMMRSAPLVPASATVRQGLAALIKARAHLAFAVTETGQYAGLFTLEDGWRAALGEPRLKPREVAPGVWLCAGDLPLAQLPVPPGELEFDPPPQTLGGLITALSGELPAAGQSLTRAGVRYTVENARERRAVRVRVEKLQAGEEGR